MLSHRTQAADVCRTTVNRDGVPASRVASSADSAENAPMSGRRESATVRLALWCKRRARAQQECIAMVEAAQPCHASPHQVFFVDGSQSPEGSSTFPRTPEKLSPGSTDASTRNRFDTSVGLKKIGPCKRARGLRHPATAGIRRPSVRDTHDHVRFDCHDRHQAITRCLRSALGRRLAQPRRSLARGRPGSERGHFYFALTRGTVQVEPFRLTRPQRKRRLCALTQQLRM